MRRLADLTFSINKVKVEHEFVCLSFLFSFKPVISSLLYMHHGSSFDQLGPGGLVLKSAKFFPRTRPQ